MELTWLANTPQSRSRTRAPRACPACQRRKKRCRHLTLGIEPTEEEAAEPPRKIRAQASNAAGDDFERRPRRRTASADPVLPSHSFHSTERFVGDLNPEAVIRERLDAPTDSPLRDRIGLWINSSTAVTQNDNVEPDRSQPTGADAISLSALPQPPTGALESQTISSILHQRYVSAMQACHALPKSTRRKLTTIFIEKIHPLVPVLDIEELKEAQTNASASTFLDRAICLVAAKSPAASPDLRLVEDGPNLSSRQFCSEVYKGLVTAMEAALEPDRLTRIRIWALMSLHCEGHEGAEAASLHLCQAIHQAQTVGLHLDRPGRTPADPLPRLFWCLWTLDKMHASIGGRPVLLADRDIGVAKPDSRIAETRGAFAVWLAVSELLATVISFYRPSAGVTSGWEEGFPAFEDIVEEHTNGDVDFATLGLLELYYHCVAILSCRYKLTESLDGTRISSIRQGLAAVRIYSIVAVECDNQLPPHPIVPYAISLSMGVSYRQLRSSKLITHFNRAKASLEACCSLLEKISPQWYSAEAMARLGRKALHQMDLNPEHRRQPQPQPQPQPQAAEAPLPRLSTVRAAPAQEQEQELELESEPPGLGLPTNTNSAALALAPGTIDMVSGMPSTAPECEGPGALKTPLENVSASASALPLVQDFDAEAPTHGFADIDMLFGEFLDLSLPTNFWDPVFAEEGQGQGQDQQHGT
ncbi:transcriptional regulator family: Fungal Specific TF [Penicillium waksmanii]|uniref:transcriptional regulator family: Fungal Specific TF n=1 Tax=Penicillium waksmanii TaxID=69791 RepID=UPI002546F10F|nr:transcriptional regulator family: Fungal Specific TF [Penicillium waksmanii]KAJ5988229.1 transcriptional regulator family: Fungal Specific TF [Penicillium waksmanii]